MEQTALISSMVPQRDAARLAGCLKLSLLQQTLSLPSSFLCEKMGDPIDLVTALTDPEAMKTLPFDLRQLCRQLYSRPDFERKHQAALTMAQKHDVKAVCLGDPDYPALLRRVSDPPLVLFHRGALPLKLLSTRRVLAVTGTLQPSAYGRKLAGRLGKDLSRQGWLALSGLSCGIDACFHQAAMAAGGRAVAVVGCGLERAFPPEQGRLFADLARRGLLISEQPPGTRASKKTLVSRQRLISGLAQDLIIPQARRRGHFLHTVSFAAEQGKEVWAMPGPIGAAECEGSNLLLQDGAAVLLHGDDLL